MHLLIVINISKFSISDINIYAEYIVAITLWILTAPTNANIKDLYPPKGGFERWDTLKRWSVAGDF